MLPLRIRRRPPRQTLTILSALSAVVALLLLTAAPAAAFQVPKGAAWYTIYDLPKSWQISEGAGVTVAVIDSGVKTSIGDLQGQTVPGIDYTGTDPGADQDDETSANYGHGTDMAVKIAGDGQGGGMVGVAPKAKIMPIDAGTGAAGGLNSAYVARGIRAAVDHGAKVINLSLGKPGTCGPDEGPAIEYAYQHGVIVVAAAGDSPGPVATPADCPGALAIGGVDASGKPWANTPSGPQIDFVSLAYNLVNEQLDGTLGGPYPGNSGTSSAAAFVSGMFALLISRYPHESARQIVTRALYAVHNGLGAGHLAQRANDIVGYGELLPYYALTQKLPANAKNPIYDRFDAELGRAQPGSTGPSASPSSGSGSPTAPTTAPTTASSSSSGGGFPTWAIIVVIAAVVIGVILAVIILSRRGNRDEPPGPPQAGYPPSGYRP